MTTLNFKLDPASLPKLTSRGDNYPEWKSSWTLAFRYAGLWPIISKKKTRPTIEADADEWDTDDTKALVMLLSSVHPDLTLTVTTCDTSAAAWEHLANQFDRDTGNTAIYLFGSLMNLRYHDGEDLRAHMNEFHQQWTRMAKRCQTYTQPVAVAMKPVFTSDEVKGSFFLTTLPALRYNLTLNLSVPPRPLTVSKVGRY